MGNSKFFRIPIICIQYWNWWYLWTIILMQFIVFFYSTMNRLMTAAFLAIKGLNTLLLERRSQIGGAAVTESVYMDDGEQFKISRCSYLAGLLRPSVISELGLQFKYLPRNPSSFTPTRVNESDPVLKGNNCNYCNQIYKTVFRLYNCCGTNEYLKP